MYWTTNSLVAADLYDELRRFQREMGRIFGGSAAETASASAVNVWGREDGLLVEAELPGVEPKDMHVSVQGDQLTVEGERTADEPAKGVCCHRRERAAGKFIHSLRLPYEVDSAKVKATYRHGVLRLELPRAEASKPQRIAITAG